MKRELKKDQIINKIKNSQKYFDSFEDFFFGTSEKSHFGKLLWSNSGLDTNDNTSSSVRSYTRKKEMYAL